MLSLREPIPNSTAIPFLLYKSQKHKDQIVYATSLSWCIPKLKTDTTLFQKFTETTKFSDLILEEAHQSNIFNTWRIPGEKTDSFFVTSKSKNLFGYIWKSSDIFDGL